MRLKWDSDGLPSRRLSWTMPENRISQEIRNARSAGVRLLDLTVSNPTRAAFDYPHEAIRAALARVTDFTYRPEPRGELNARRAVAEYYALRGMEISAEQIALTASTSEAYGLLFKLLCDPGHEVLIPTPSYPLFEYLATLESVRTRPYRLHYDGSWHIDRDSLVHGCNQRTRAIVVVNPNNPTGSFLDEEGRQWLLEFAGERDLPVISDEVFMDYALRPIPLARRTLNRSNGGALLFTLGGLSKCAAMPQLKLAWIVANGNRAKAEPALERLEIILDTYLSVNTPVTRALPELFQIGRTLERAIRERAVRNLQTMTEGLAGSPANPLFTEAGWSVIVQLPRTRGEEESLLRYLQRYQAIAQPGFFFDMPAEPFLVFSLLTPENEWAQGVERLRKMVEES